MYYAEDEFLQRYKEDVGRRKGEVAAVERLSEIGFIFGRIIINTVVAS